MKIKKDIGYYMKLRYKIDVFSVREYFEDWLKEGREIPEPGKTIKNKGRRNEEPV